MIMATQRGIDLGQVYKTTEDVKSSRQSRDIKNKLFRWKAADRELASARSNKLAGMKRGVAAGQEGSMMELTLFDAKEASAITAALSSADERKRKQMSDNNEAMGRIYASIKNSPDPSSQYVKSRKYLERINPEMVSNMPEQYTPEYVDFELGRTIQLDDHIKGSKVSTFGGEDIREKLGAVVERTESGAMKTAKAKAGKGAGLKSGDEALMYRQAGELLGGLFDQEGNLQNLDPATRGKVQSIATEAARIFQKGGTRSDAVTKAARKLGIKIKALGQPGQGDRNALLQQYLPK